MIRRPPRSTLFPSRRSSDLIFEPPLHLRVFILIHHPSSAQWEKRLELFVIASVDGRNRKSFLPLRGGRSEEHTSELQSPDQLVCRLLLAKKQFAPYPPVSNV